MAILDINNIEIEEIDIDTAKMTSNAMDNEFLSKVIQIIEDNISDEKFSTEDLANKLFMSRSNLYIKMNAISGEAPANFIRRIRFNKGCQMLLEGRYTVAEISNKKVLARLPISPIVLRNIWECFLPSISKSIRKKVIPEVFN